MFQNNLNFIEVAFIKKLVTDIDVLSGERNLEITRICLEKVKRDNRTHLKVFKNIRGGINFKIKEGNLTVTKGVPFLDKITKDFNFNTKKTNEADFNIY